MNIIDVIVVPATTSVSAPKASSRRRLVRVLSTIGVTLSNAVAHALRSTHSRASCLACLPLLAFEDVVVRNALSVRDDDDEWPYLHCYRSPDSFSWRASSTNCAQQSRYRSAFLLSLRASGTTSTQAMSSPSPTRVLRKPAIASASSVSVNAHVA
jgi:hypothetical protein